MRKMLFVGLVACLLLVGLVAPVSAAAPDDLGDCERWVETTYKEVVDQEAWTETVVVEEAYWQRYSWTGGHRAEDNPPEVAPPHENWQANVKGDPHGIGEAGLYSQPRGNSDNAAWFYLEYVDEVTETIEHEATYKTVVDVPGYVEDIPGCEVADNPECPKGEFGEYPNCYIPPENDCLFGPDYGSSEYENSRDAWKEWYEENCLDEEVETPPGNGQEPVPGDDVDPEPEPEPADEPETELGDPQTIDRSTQEDSVPFVEVEETEEGHVLVEAADELPATGTNPWLATLLGLALMAVGGYTVRRTA